MTEYEEIDDATIERLKAEERDYHTQFAETVCKAAWDWASHADHESILEISEMDIVLYPDPKEGMLELMGWDEGDFFNQGQVCGSHDWEHRGEAVAYNFVKGVKDFVESACEKGVFQR